MLLKINLQSKVVEIFLILWYNLSYYKWPGDQHMIFCYKESLVPLILRFDHIQSGATESLTKGRLV